MFSVHHRLSAVFVAVVVGISLCCCQGGVFAADEVDDGVPVSSCNQCPAKDVGGQSVPTDERQAGCHCSMAGQAESYAIQTSPGAAAHLLPVPSAVIGQVSAFADLALPVVMFSHRGATAPPVHPVPQRILFCVFTI